MSARGVRLIVLCEDDEHRRFAHHAFRKLGRHYSELRAIVCPAAHGAGEKWVREHYAKEVRAHRRNASSQEGLALVVVIDADKQTVEHRYEQLDDALEQSGVQCRGRSERIMIWVPKRHIETWVADLLGHSVNEEGDYKNLMRDADYRPAAEEFVERCRNPSRRPAAPLPSMSRAYEETDRLPQ
jgi:hypothetical protein